MRHFTAVIERDPETGLYVGWVPGFPGRECRLDQFSTVSSLKPAKWVGLPVTSTSPAT